MQMGSRDIGLMVLLVVLALFAGGLLSTGKQRGFLMGSAALGLAIGREFLRIGAKERTAR